LADLFAASDEEADVRLLDLYPDEKAAAVLDAMPSDDAADLIMELAPEKAARLTSILKFMGSDIPTLAAYDEDTSGGIMATEFVTIGAKWSVAATIAFLRRVAPTSTISYYLYVVEKHDRLVGVVSLRSLITASPEARIRDIADPRVISVSTQMDQEEVAGLFRKYSFLSLPVVNEDGEIIGIITADDIMDVMEEEATEDMYRLAGISDDEERVFSPVLLSVRRRLPWLLFNLATAFMAAAVVGLFESTIAKLVALASFLPVVAGQGGNAATQTITVMVRGIAIGELTLQDTWRALVKEFLVGLFNGIGTGIVVGIVGAFWVHNPWFGLVIGAAMVLNMMAAALAGVAVPALLKLVHVDPALASAIFVTTVTDVFGFFSFLGLATLFMNRLL
jgi:magnesium transporter